MNAYTTQKMIIKFSLFLNWLYFACFKKRPSTALKAIAFTNPKRQNASIT